MSPYVRVRPIYLIRDDGDSARRAAALAAAGAEGTEGAEGAEVAQTDSKTDSQTDSQTDSGSSNGFVASLALWLRTAMWARTVDTAGRPSTR